MAVLLGGESYGRNRVSVKDLRKTFFVNIFFDGSYGKRKRGNRRSLSENFPRNRTISLGTSTETNYSFGTSSEYSIQRNLEYNSYMDNNINIAQSSFNIGKYKFFDYYLFISNKRKEVCSIVRYKFDTTQYENILSDVLAFLEENDDLDFQAREKCHDQKWQETVYVTKSINAISVSCDKYEAHIELFGHNDYVSNNFFEDLANKYEVKVEEIKENKIFFLMQRHNQLLMEAFELPVLDIQIEKQYNDDFQEISEAIIEDINSDKTGLILLHGEAGTGKTSFVQYLTNEVRRKIVFIPPSMFKMLQDPSFLDFLYENRGCTMIIEDSEALLRDRKFDGNADCSFLLNITDGFISKILNMQVICSFNCALSEIDSALLRKGRLLNAYEFKKLNKEKVKILLEEQGYTVDNVEDMTLGDIYNFKHNNNKQFVKKERTKIGFTEID
jgi:hypothetical protein